MLKRSGPNRIPGNLRDEDDFTFADDPQNTLRQNMEDLLKNPKCSDFVDKLLGYAFAETANLPVSNNVLSMFDMISQQGGVHFGPSTYHGVPVSTAEGSLGMGDAKINISNAYAPNPRLDGLAGIHETLHVAGRYGGLATASLRRPLITWWQHKGGNQYHCQTETTSRTLTSGIWQTAGTGMHISVVLVSKRRGKMETSKITVICACLILIICTHAHAKEWRGIVPLHSTREDIERILGSPLRSLPSGRYFYDLKDNKVFVRFSKGPCDESSEWNVPSNTVISIIVTPKRSPQIGELRIDQIRYKKQVDKNLEGHNFYIDEDEGEVIETYEGRVIAFHHKPAARDTQLRCSNTLADRCATGEVNCDPRKFNEYSDIFFKDQRAHLDNFRAQLHENQDMQGYIIVYGGRRGRAGEARMHADSAKNYLVNQRGIEARRIVSVTGGYREDLTVELWLWPLDISAPYAAPTVHPSEVQIIKNDNVRTNKRRSSPAPRKQRRQ